MILVGGDRSLTSRGKSFLTRFTADDRRVQNSLISANDFDDSIEFEDKTFEGMLESLPLDGGHGVTFINYYAKSVALQLTAYQRLCLNGRFLLPWGREYCFFSCFQVR
jgi:hypothetical protein